jgi:hypothetical protein
MMKKVIFIKKLIIKSYKELKEKKKFKKEKLKE